MSIAIDKYWRNLHFDSGKNLKILTKIYGIVVFLGGGYIKSLRMLFYNFGHFAITSPLRIDK